MASAVPVYEDQSVSIGRVFQRAFSAVKLNPVVILLIALVIGAIPSLALRYGMYRLGLTSPDALRSGAVTPRGFGGVTFLSSMMTLIIAAFVQGALTRATLSASDGRKATFGESVSAATAVVLPLVGLSLLWGVAVGIGFVLLVVPGVILLLMWAVAVPALVIEREGVIAAFRRSAELTAGSRWKILGLFLLIAVIYILIYVVAGAIGLRLYDPSNADLFSVTAVVTNLILAIVANTLWGTIQPSLYLELRQSKEGGSIENLEEVFA